LISQERLLLLLLPGTMLPVLGFFLFCSLNVTDAKSSCDLVTQFNFQCPIIPLVYIYALVSFPVFSLILLSPVYGFPFAYFF